MVDRREHVEELERRGWLPDSDNPAPAVRTTMDRLATNNTNIIKGRQKGGVPSGSTTDPLRMREPPSDQ